MNSMKSCKVADIQSLPGWPLGAADAWQSEVGKVAKEVLSSQTEEAQVVATGIAAKAAAEEAAVRMLG